MTMLKTIALLVVLLQISVIVFSAKAGKCGGVLKNKSAEITTPNYPNNYPDNITCKWDIATETTHIKLSIEDFALEESPTCDRFDYAKISFKREWGSEEGIVECGSIAPRQVTLHVKGFSVQVIFHSDLSLSNRGFKLRYKGFDVDPCLMNKGGCSHFCNLTKGKRQCSCPSGFLLSYDRSTCRYNTSCYFVGYKECPYSSNLYCRDLPDGKHTCVCYSGYKKANNVCKDIDECTEKPGVCNPGKCTNRQGYYRCTCPAGYTSYGTSCNDRDECKARNPPNCGNGTCVNTVGSYVCQCEPGYYFNKTLVNCQDRDECAINNGGCSHECLNSPGNHSCLCRPGFYLDNDRKSCRELKIEQMGEIKEATICQGQKRQISCDAKALVIYKATYGRVALGRDVCRYKERAVPAADTDDSSTEALGCGQKNVTDKITEMCGWKKTCDFVANDSLLGRVCPGIYKYLNVFYGCGVPVRCPLYPQIKLCPYPTPLDECATDDDCDGSEMCCHTGCETVCLEPTSYYRED